MITDIAPPSQNFMQPYRKDTLFCHNISPFSYIFPEFIVLTESQIICALTKFWVLNSDYPLCIFLLLSASIIIYPYLFLKKKNQQVFLNIKNLHISRNAGILYKNEIKYGSIGDPVMNGFLKWVFLENCSAFHLLQRRTVRIPSTECTIMIL